MQLETWGLPRALRFRVLGRCAADGICGGPRARVSRGSAEISDPQRRENCFRDLVL